MLVIFVAGFLLLSGVRSAKAEVYERDYQAYEETQRMIEAQQQYTQQQQLQNEFLRQQEQMLRRFQNGQQNYRGPDMSVWQRFNRY